MTEIHKNQVVVDLSMVKNPRSSTDYSVKVAAKAFEGAGGAYHRLMEDCNLLLLSSEPIPGGSSRTVNMDRIEINPKRTPFDSNGGKSVRSTATLLRKNFIVVDLQPLADLLDRGGPEPQKSGSIWG